MISFQFWQDAYRDAGIPEPDCWKEGLLKPDNHTVSVSDLAYIAGFHGMCTLGVGEIAGFLKNGQGIVLKDKREWEMDIIIKCTGFLTNHDTVEITGCDKTWPNAFLDFNLGFQAEPLLDGAQFGSTKGRVAEDGEASEMAKQIKFIQGNFHRMSSLPEDVQEGSKMKGNPFGSGYTGQMLVNFDYHAWCATVPERQKNAMGMWGDDGKLPTIRCWISELGALGMQTYYKLLANYWRAQDEERAQLEGPSRELGEAEE